MKKLKVFIVHHTNQGTPERGEVHEVCATKKLALESMKKELEVTYDVTLAENKKEGDIWMYVSDGYDVVTY